MQSNIQLSPGVVDRDMGHVLQGRSSRQQKTSSVVIEKNPSPWTEKDLLFQDRHKFGQHLPQPYLDPNCRLKQMASKEQVAQSKSLKNNQILACGDELVKNMSNLPGFLQPAEKGRSVQEKALNFGVLDWKRLEKWKYNERMPGNYHKKPSSSSSNVSCSGIGSPKLVANFRKQPSSNGLNSNSVNSGRQPMVHSSRFSLPRRQPPPMDILLISPPKEEKKSARYNGEVFVRRKGKSNCELQAAQSSMADKCHEKVKFYNRRCHIANANSNKEDPNTELTIEKEASSSERGKHEFPLLSHDKINAQGKESKMKLDEVNVASEGCPATPDNTVVQEPKHFPKRSCSDSSQFTGSRTSLDGQFAELMGNKSSGLCSAQELYSEELSVDIPHSCPIPSAGTVHSNCATSLAIDSDICSNAFPSENCATSVSEAKYSVLHEKSKTPSVEASNKEDAAGKPTLKGRPPSPTRRFSFSLGKMSRSFSFKESSTVSQLSSMQTTVKSGPVSPGVATLDDFEIDKANARSRGRSSPLRRLLDPLLKYKGHQSSENIRQPKGTLHSMAPRSTGTKGSSQDRKLQASNFQALLQLSLKNGLPLFKLMVDNSNDMLAAVVKRLPTSGKADPCLIYAFYSVNEIRKKSMNWMAQGSKSESCSLGYNLVGKMKISSSYSSNLSKGDSSECDARECVLYSVGPGEANKQTSEFTPCEEIAAIVVRNTSEMLNDQESSGTPFETEEEYKNSNGTLVILPGGVHGLPIKGKPSSLISRWRSGGSCDCGGWDIGCRLRVLVDNEKGSKSLQASMPGSTIDHVTLCMQGGERMSKPVFRLEPFGNGLYSIHSDASISLLEAFATCVAYLTCRKFSEIIDDAKDQPDAEHSLEAIIKNDKVKTPTTFPGQGPAKYITCPPLSPVGRI